jgi:hypothetical protein
VILLPPDSEVDLGVPASTLGLLTEIVGEMLRVFPEVTMNVYEHET